MLWMPSLQYLHYDDWSMEYIICYTHVLSDGLVFLQKRSWRFACGPYFSQMKVCMNILKSVFDISNIRNKTDWTESKGDAIFMHRTIHRMYAMHRTVCGMYAMHRTVCGTYASEESPARRFCQFEYYSKVIQTSQTELFSIQKHPYNLITDMHASLLQTLHL